MAAEDNKWFYNPETGEVAQGLAFDAMNRMGPYDSEEDARNALTIAQQREEAAEAYDEQDKEWGTWQK